MQTVDELTLYRVIMMMIILLLLLLLLLLLMMMMIIMMQKEMVKMWINFDREIGFHAGLG